MPSSYIPRSLVKIPSDPFMTRNIQAHTTIMMNYAIKSALRRGFLGTEQQAIIKSNSPMAQRRRQERRRRLQPFPLPLPRVLDGSCDGRDSDELNTSSTSKTTSGSKRKRSDIEPKEPLLKTSSAMGSGAGWNFKEAHSSRTHDAKAGGLRSQERRRNVHGLKLDLQSGLNWE